MESHKWYIFRVSREMDDNQKYAQMKAKLKFVKCEHRNETKQHTKNQIRGIKLIFFVWKCHDTLFFFK